jgi:3',5'-cyclic AMP phosphodiesterase CpdA
MRTIVHLSDLHFGRLDERILAPLAHRIAAIAPDLVAVSGDLTQRARRRQFERARAFLGGLQFPTLAVPGNHDVPLYDLARRLFDPFGRYRRYINPDLEPAHIDSEMAVIGLNSARVFVLRGRGRLHGSQVDAAAARLRTLDRSTIKVVVTHHPFDLPAGFRTHHLVGGAPAAMARLAEAGVDLFLSGHLHVSHVGHAAERYRIAGHSGLIVQAGTLSTRSRGELNTFNVLRFGRSEMTVERYSWTAGRQTFERSFAGRFRHSASGWTA